MNKIKNLIYRASQNDTFMRAFHTAWQGFLVVFLAGLPLVVHLLHAHAFSAAESALISLVIASAMAALAAVRKQAASLFLGIVSRVRG